MLYVRHTINTEGSLIQRFIFKYKNTSQLNKNKRVEPPTVQWRVQLFLICRGWDISQKIVILPS